MIRNIIVAILLAGCIVGISFLLFNHKNDVRICKDVVVDIKIPKGAMQFMRDSDVVREVIAKGFKFKGLPLDSIDMSGIEAMLDDNPLFNNAQVTNSPAKEQLVISLEQKYPKYIVQMKNNLYYVGENKKLIPVNLDYMVDVPLVTGDIDSLSAVKAYPLIETIQGDSIMRNFVGQVYYDKYNGFTIVSRVANVPIILGFEDTNWTDKMDKVYTFIKRVEPKIGWNKIKYVNLSFHNQIVVADKFANNNSPS